MANTRSLFCTSLTAGVGLTALYYGVSWLMEGLKAIHAANQAQRSSTFSSLSNIARQIDNENLSRDPSLAGGPALIKAINSRNQSTARFVKLYGLGAAAVGGLLLFGAYGAGRSLSTNAETLVNAGAAVIGAVKAFNRI